MTFFEAVKKSLATMIVALAIVSVILAVIGVYWLIFQATLWVAVPLAITYSVLLVALVIWKIEG